MTAKYKYDPEMKDAYYYEMVNLTEEELRKAKETGIIESDDDDLKYFLTLIEYKIES